VTWNSGSFSARRKQRALDNNPWICQAMANACTSLITPCEIINYFFDYRNHFTICEYIKVLHVISYIPTTKIKNKLNENREKL
jgi:hypothetical protein